MIGIPKINPVADVVVTEPEVDQLDNGIEVYGFNGGANDVIKMDVIFSAGRWTEQKPLSAAATSALIKSGTHEESAFDLEEKIDYLGSTIKASAGYNGFTLSIYCMTRYLEESLKIFQRILFQGTFPERELNIYKSNSLARLKVNLLKNDYVGDMAFKKMLFGEDHPYGYETTAESIDSLDREAIRDYYKNNFTLENCFIGLAGKYGRTEIDLINKYLGQKEAWSGKSNIVASHDWTMTPASQLKVVEKLKDSVQASIYIGMPSIERKHEDYQSLSFLNLIYGGYFGSRLMKNIREDKGMTYGIYSYIQHYKHAAAFIINTETGIEYADACIDEIYAEMERLRHQQIGEKELRKARNYMMGRLLDQVDGPFNSAGTFFGLKSHNIPLSYIHETVNALKDADPEVLMSVAQKYFDKEGMYEVVVK